MFTVQDNYSSPAEPTETLTFGSYGLTAYDVQYWDGSAWVTVSGGSITGNNKVWRKITFTAITTSKIRVLANAAIDNGYSRISEVEAWSAASGDGSSSSNIQWLVTDQLGTPRMILDKTGSLAAVKRHDYLPFGEELFAGTGGRTGGLGGLGYTADTTRQKFTLKERDIETGLDYFLARYYSPTQGRFTSPDEFSGGPDELYDFAEDASENPTFYAELDNPQSLNKYQYTYNNPINLTDDDGHCPICVVVVVAVLVLTSPDTTHAPTGNETEPLAPSGDGFRNMMFTATVGAIGGPILSKLAKPFARAATRFGSKGSAQAGPGTKGLGSPFKGKSPEQAAKMLAKKGFKARGPNPVSGKGGYVNPKSGRSYHIDRGGKYKKGVEKPHVDVNRPKGTKLPKKKLPLQDSN